MFTICSIDDYLLTAVDSMFNDMRRLYPRGSANPGLCVDAEGAMLGSERVLVQRTLKGFRALERDEAAALQKSVLSESKDHDWLFRQCGRIADALTRGEVALAQIYGLHIPVADLDEHQLARIAPARFGKTGFDPDEPRRPKGDPHGGEWTTGLDGGGGTSASPETPALDTAATADAASEDSGGGDDTGDASETGDNTPNGGEDTRNPALDFRIVSPDDPGGAPSAGVPENTSTPATPDGLPDIPQPGQGTQLIPTAAGFVGNEATWLASLTPTMAGALRQMLLEVDGAGVVLGFLFIPTNRSPIVEGPITNVPGASYRYDSDMGILQIRADIGPLGPIVVSEGHVGTDGVFRDAQGRIIGHYFAGSGFVIDARALPGFRMLPGSATAPDAGTRSDDRPKLCPDPTPDNPGAPLDNPYQRYINILVNGRALPPGMAVSLFNPISGKDVMFDDCRLTDGTMIEAKGDGYLEMLLKGSNNMPWIGVQEKLLKQADAQIGAARGRPIEWYFKAQPVADYVRDLFERRDLPITVIYAPQPE